MRAHKKRGPRDIVLTIDGFTGTAERLRRLAPPPRLEYMRIVGAALILYDVIAEKERAGATILVRNADGTLEPLNALRGAHV